MLFSSPAFDHFLHTSQNRLTEETAHFKRGEETVRVSLSVCYLTGHSATRDLKTTIFRSELVILWVGSLSQTQPGYLICFHIVSFAWHSHISARVTGRIGGTVGIMGSQVFSYGQILQQASSAFFTGFLERGKKDHVLTCELFHGPPFICSSYIFKPLFIFSSIPLGKVRGPGTRCWWWRTPLSSVGGRYTEFVWFVDYNFLRARLHIH